MRIAGTLQWYAVNRPAFPQVYYTTTRLFYIFVTNETFTARRRTWHDIYNIYRVRLIAGSYRRLNNTKAVSKVII
jgi:hypothetical protein